MDSLGEHELTTETYPTMFVTGTDIEEDLPTALSPCSPCGRCWLYRSAKTPDIFAVRNITAALSTPLSRFQSFLELSPSARSRENFNTLLELAIRHTSYAQAFRILRWMNSEQVKPDDRTLALYVRLLVRTGRRDAAWSFVRRILAHRAPANILDILVEVLGDQDSNYRAIHRPSISDSSRRKGAAYPFARDVCRMILSCISQTSQTNDHRSDRVILAATRSLLRSSEIQTARDLTLRWISRLQGFISKPRRRRILGLLHLHLESWGTGTNAFFKGRTFSSSFLDKHPCLRPDSSTLFLLLRPLIRAQTHSTTHALQLIRSFRKKWGPRVIDSRVRRRIAAIATREGNLSVAREYLDAEAKASLSRDRRAVRDRVAYCPICSPSSYITPRRSSISEKVRWVRMRRRLRTRVRQKTMPRTMYHKQPQYL